jgi:cobalamin biosynthesis Mg chelatase CobN
MSCVTPWTMDEEGERGDPPVHPFMHTFVHPHMHSKTPPTKQTNQPTNQTNHPNNKPTNQPNQTKQTNQTKPPTHQPTRPSKTHRCVRRSVSSEKKRKMMESTASITAGGLSTSIPVCCVLVVGCMVVCCSVCPSLVVVFGCLVVWLCGCGLRCRSGVLGLGEW